MYFPEIFYYYYYALLLVGSILSVLCYYTGDKRSLYIFLLLISTLIEENLRLYLKDVKLSSAYVVNLFAGIEYSFFTFYALNVRNKRSTQLWLKVSVILFLCYSVFNGILVYQSTEKYKYLITRNINIEGILLFIVYTHLLFNIDAKIPLPIFRHSEFWVAVGVLLFYGGVFVVLGLYPVLIKMNSTTTPFIYENILRPLNITLYLCILGGSVCYLINKKYLTR